MKTFLVLLLLFLLKNSCFGNTYYISSKGNNNNNGLSPEKPWKSLKNFTYGNSYLFCSSDTFYLSIDQIKGTSNNTKVNISSYGSGSKPVLCGYKLLDNSKWQKVKNNIWSFDIGNSTNYSGLTSSDDNVGFLKVNGKIMGRKFKDISKLMYQWDFYSDKKLLYIYSESNPGLLKNTIHVSSNVCLIRLSDNMEIKNIAVVGTGGHAIQGAKLSNITIDNVYISEVGGSFLIGFRDNDVRYGNGIEFVGSATNCMVTNCDVSEVYDAAYTFQGSGKASGFINITFSNNVARRNEQSFEFWLKDGSETGIINCKFVSNRCYDAGFGWSHPVRPDKDAGVHILTYGLEMKNLDLIIENNIFSKAKTALYFYFDNSSWPKFISRNNTISLHAGTPIRSIPPSTKKIRYSVFNPQSFVSSSGYEKGSKFTIIPSVTP